MKMTPKRSNVVEIFLPVSQSFPGDEYEWVDQELFHTKEKIRSL